MKGILAHVALDLISASGPLFQALNGFLVQPLGMHARTGELVAQVLGDGLGLICLGIWYGQPSKTQADGNDQDQGFK